MRSRDPIVDQLKVKLLPEEKKAIAAAPTKSVEAYTYCLRVCLRCHGWLILRRSRLPIATWIIASETSRRCS